MHYPKKSLGQNFLIDKNIAKKIVNLINNIENNNIIEIGPGKGALTDIIIEKKPKKLFLIEKDNYYYKQLSEKYKNIKFVKVFNDDALSFNFNKITKPKSIVSNLPYNISIKLIIDWLNQINNYKEIIVMIQKEVAEKMNYKNSKKKNRLNVLAEICSDFKIEFTVSKNVFFPRPKILSSVISIKPKKKILKNTKDFENFTRKLFRNKRKKIINVLHSKDIENLRIKEVKDKKKYIELINLRAEDLSIEDILNLYKALS